MRGDPEAHELIAPRTLTGVLSLLASEPGQWTPIAGGTELMVAFAAGRLTARKLVNLWGVPDLRFIRTEPDRIVIGAGSTFRDLRKDPTVSAEFPLIAKAASWIGSIANQSRATLGGNQLLYAVHLPRRFAQHRQYLRKVGTRRAMAISKTALAGCALIEQGVVREIRIAAASIAAFPTRLYRAEDVVSGQSITSETIRAARAAALSEIVPIDDIRSTAEYRRVVTVNLLQEFLGSLPSAGGES